MTQRPWKLVTVTEDRLVSSVDRRSRCMLRWTYFYTFKFFHEKNKYTDVTETRNYTLWILWENLSSKLENYYEIIEIYLPLKVSHLQIIILTSKDNKSYIFGNKFRELTRSPITLSIVKRQEYHIIRDYKTVFLNENSRMFEIYKRIPG